MSVMLSQRHGSVLIMPSLTCSCVHFYLKKKENHQLYLTNEERKWIWKGHLPCSLEIWKIVMLHSTKIAQDCFGEAERGGHQLLQGIEHVHRSSHALFITSSFHCNQLEEVVSLV